MKKLAIVCFAKTPGLTPAKTRLAQDIGAERSQELYQLLVNRCKELMKQLEEFSPFVAVNEASALVHPVWQGLQCYQQTSGALGDKLAHAEEYFLTRFEQVMFWGTDAPALTAEHFFTAAQNLATHQSTVVPAHDGGFALYANSTRLAEGSWQKIHYSTSTTCAELMSHMRPAPLVTGPISDLDTFADIPVAIREMERMPSQGPAWDTLKDFLRRL